ncbi:hypothetical protein ANN_03640 [Periplaneta americana]|uniref:Uncharacterized protein n=1 Tax=Periplaneta americana TaxID=6978 RepID=A0ABQ8U0Q5_PERAM|nr:hypothetical protein ANN_03640 [Periplaneta americana]
MNNFPNNIISKSEFPKYKFRKPNFRKRHFPNVVFSGTIFETILRRKIRSGTGNRTRDLSALRAEGSFQLSYAGTRSTVPVELLSLYCFTAYYLHLNLCNNAGEMSPGSSTESYPAFARIGLRENPGKNLNQVTCSYRESNPGHLVSRPDALTVDPYRWLFHDAVSTTRLFSVDEIGDSEMVFGEMRPRIHHRLPGIHLTVGENLGKTQPGNQPKRRSNPHPSATSDRQASACYTFSSKCFICRSHEDGYVYTSSRNRRFTVKLKRPREYFSTEELITGLRFEISATQPSEVNEEKKKIYEPTIQYLSAKYDIEKITVTGLFFGARGTIPKAFVKWREKYKLTRDLQDAIVTTIIKFSVAIFRQHLYGVHSI